MLELYAARENIDKERFIYDRITQDGNEALVLVPDQYTLVAEEQALRYLDAECLFRVEILSMNRLGLRVLAEQGRESVPMLDKYGRFMLLTKLIREHMDDFDIFRRSAGKLTFTAMLSDFISDFKQQECSLTELGTMLDAGDADPLLSAKLSELEGVITAYTQAIEGRFTDSEDYIAMYVDAIKKSQMLRGKSVWIYGYDSITPKFANAVSELAAVCDSAGFIVNLTDFELDEKMTGMLRAVCGSRGIKVSYDDIGQEYEIPKSETIRRIERGLWRGNLNQSEKDANAVFVPEDITLVSAANPYCEAESAAAYVQHLIRDCGYRMRDIQIIANDEAVMHPIVRRVFAEYGLPVFADTARDITDTAAVSFIVDLLWFVIYNNSARYLMAMLKTGLAGYDDEIIEDLENYVRNYRIRGSMWERDFRYGEDTVGTETFTALNEMRGDLMDRVKALKDIAAGRDAATGCDTGSTADFVVRFRRYLRDVWDLDRRVEDAANHQEEMGLHDEAQRMVQSYRKALELLDQIAEIMGDTGLDIAEFTDIYVTGLSDVKVGVIPPAADGLSVGTMIRTRPRPVRAAVVLGANEGVLPLSPSPEGLFSVDEKEYFREKGFPIGSLDDIRLNEEKAAMYRMLSKPSEKLYISWSAAGAGGSETAPSELIEAVKELFPRIEKDGLIRSDIVSEGWGMDLITSPDESMRHLTEHIKDRNVTDYSDLLTQSLLKWFSVNRKEDLHMMLRSAYDQNDPEPLGHETAAALFGRRDGTLSLSASSINTYFECPFRYYVSRGLKPLEERDFSSDPRSIGDAYHECLMAVARRLTGDNELLRRIASEESSRRDQAAGDSAEGTENPGSRSETEPESGEDLVSGAERESGSGTDRAGSDDARLTELERIVAEELDRIAADYQGGLFVSTGIEQFRMSRIREICSMAAAAMAEQLAAESVTGAEFEEVFRRGGRFDPIRMTVDGKEVLVEGKIDRVDHLAVEGNDRARIIDYKTGTDKLDLWKMRNGYKMQLMIYMISASSDGLEPAGIFYFNISDPIVSIDKKSKSQIDKILDKEAQDAYKLKGVYVQEEGVLAAMPAEVIEGGGKKGITREEYESLRKDVLSRIEETASGILSGSIGIRPLIENTRLICNNCSYRPICRHDSEYGKNAGRKLPPKA